jgi:hypothetical protein
MQVVAADLYRLPPSILAQLVLLLPTLQRETVELVPIVHLLHQALLHPVRGLPARDQDLVQARAASKVGALCQFPFVAF